MVINMDDKNLKNKNDEEMDIQDEKVEETKVDIKNLENEFENLKKIADGFEASYKRALADYQNLQRRVQEERYSLITGANKNLILKFLPVLDTLMLAVKHFQDPGLNLAVEQFLKVLEEEGLKRINTIGEKFNPEKMEAVTTKEGKDGIVLEELRIGFEKNNEIIRPAQVIVGKK